MSDADLVVITCGGGCLTSFKMRVVFNFGVVLSIVKLGYCQVLPVDKCQLEDSACMKAAFQKAIPVFAGGLPDQGVEVLDAVNLGDFAIDMSGLHFTLKQGKLIGLKKATIDNVTWNTKNKTIAVTFHLDVIAKGHYTANGKVLVLPITGDGQMKIKLKHIEITVFMSYNIEKGADGKEYAILKKHSFEYDTKENIHFSLTNLFNGNKELSDTMLNFLNENWKEIDLEFGRPFINLAIKAIYKSAKAYLSKNALSDIANV